MCWKTEKIKTYFGITTDLRGFKQHMASKHFDFVDEYLRKCQMVNEMKSIKKQRQEELSRALKLVKSKARVGQKQKEIKVKEEMGTKIDSKKLYESELFDSGLFVILENGKTVRVGEPSDPNNPQDTLFTFNYFEKVIDEKNVQAVRCLICAALIEKGIESQDSRIGRKRGILNSKWKKKHIRRTHPIIYNKSFLIDTKENERFVQATQKKIRDAREEMLCSRQAIIYLSNVFLSSLFSLSAIEIVR